MKDEKLIKQRFNKYVNKTDSCWLWTGACDSNGYGSFYCKPSYVGTHRMSWVLNKGAIPQGMWVLHHCDVKNCVNPEHLYIGDIHDNGRDAADRKRIPRARWTHCEKGHEFTTINTAYRSRKQGGRECKICVANRSEVNIKVRKKGSTALTPNKVWYAVSYNEFILSDEENRIIYTEGRTKYRPRVTESLVYIGRF